MPSPHEGRRAAPLDHRGLDTYGERAAEIRGSIDSEGGWTGLLASYAQVAAT